MSKVVNEQCLVSTGLKTPSWIIQKRMSLLRDTRPVSTHEEMDGSCPCTQSTPFLSPATVSGWGHGVYLDVKQLTVLTCLAQRRPETDPPHTHTKGQIFDPICFCYFVLGLHSSEFLRYLRWTSLISDTRLQLRSDCVSLLSDFDFLSKHLFVLPVLIDNSQTPHRFWMSPTWWRYCVQFVTSLLWERNLLWAHFIPRVGTGNTQQKVLLIVCPVRFSMEFKSVSALRSDLKHLSSILPFEAWLVLLSKSHEPALMTYVSSRHSLLFAG